MRNQSTEGRPRRNALAVNDNRDWRVFCAIELPGVVQEKIRAHIASLKTIHSGASVSWSRPENIHLTLKFFGNIEPSRISKISEAADLAIKPLHPFNIVVGGSGVFPGASRARVLWIGVADPDHKLGQLQSTFEDECARVGFEKESRAFHPHLTIGRVRRPEAVRALADDHLKMKFEDVKIEVKELIVFRSELSSKGSKYTALSKHVLRVR